MRYTSLIKLACTFTFFFILNCDLHNPFNETTYTSLKIQNHELIPTANPTLFINMDIDDSANAANWSVGTNLQVDDQAYGDRTYTIKTLPSVYAGCGWIRSAANSKTYTGATLVRFEVTSNTEVLVVHDDRITTKPGWLRSGWIDTGNDIIDSVDVIYSVFSKIFQAGASVALGPNGQASGCIGYFVILKASSATPTPAPTVAPYVFYDDALNTDFENRSRDSTRNFNSTAYVYSGTKALAFTVTRKWGDLRLHKSSSPYVDTAAFTYIRFYINGGTGDGLQFFKIGITDGAHNYSGPLLIDSYIEGGGGISANTWKKVEIPLVDFTASPFSIEEILIFDINGHSIDRTVYIDKLELY